MLDSKNVQPLTDFNWEEFENGTNVNVSKEELEKAYDETLNKVSEHQVVDGTVISIDKKEVVVNIGYKSDGVIPASEFRYNPDLKIGDTVEVYVENQEDKKGQLLLSHKKARLSKSWERVNAALDNEEIIQGYIKCRTKGGMIVDVFGIEAFLPGSQIDVHPIRDYDVFVGKTMEFKVVKINQEFRNVVVSHKALIEAELEAQKKEIISKLEKGQILEGTVKNITSYGVFVDLGGVDGLIHITDLSWGRVSDPHEVVSLDQKINVVILDFDNDKKRIALGLKQLTPHPWDALDPNLKVGDHVKGKVVVIADYGAYEKPTGQFAEPTGDTVYTMQPALLLSSFLHKNNLYHMYADTAVHIFRINPASDSTVTDIQDPRIEVLYTFATPMDGSPWLKYSQTDYHQLFFRTSDGGAIMEVVPDAIYLHTLVYKK